MVKIPGSMVLYIAVLGGLDVTTIVALTLSIHATDQPSMNSGQVDTVADTRPMDGGFALCLNRFDGVELNPTSAAITYLDSQIDDSVRADEVRTWFGSLEPHFVDVYKLETRHGRRRISFEIQRGKWLPWAHAATGLSGPDVCAAVRAALLAAGVGRPIGQLRTPGNTDVSSGIKATAQEQVESATMGDRSRFDFEFIYARRPHLYREIVWVGTLKHALEADTFAELRQWLNHQSE